jgi:hypothetical protein
LFASIAALSSRNARYCRPRVDRQREVAAFLRRADRRDVLDRLAAPVDDHAPRARNAASQFCCASSMPSWPGVAVAGEPEHVARHLAARVVAPERGLLVHALDAQRERALGDLGRHELREVDEVVGRVDARLERGRLDVEHARELREVVASSASWPANAHSDLTGVDTASGSPWRSTMRPRCAGSSSSRE